MTTKKKSCTKPATVMVKLGAGPEVPLCEDDLADARARSAKAGKVPLPKGATRAQAAAHSHANRDDKLPILVRPLNEIEKENAPRCLVSHLEA
jgi:hypothetical protein